jgi:hypothetical protein
VQGQGMRKVTLKICLDLPKRSKKYFKRDAARRGSGKINKKFYWEVPASGSGSYKNGLQKCFTKMVHKNVLQKCVMVLA